MFLHYLKLVHNIIYSIYFILITFVIYFLFVFAFPLEILALVDAIFWNSKWNKVFDLIWFELDKRKGSSGVVKGVSWSNAPKMTTESYPAPQCSCCLSMILIYWPTPVLYQFCFEIIYMLCATCCSYWLFCVLKALLKSLEFIF